MIFDLSDFDEDRSTLLADRTMEAGLQNCHERAALALEAAPAEWRARLHLCRGLLHTTNFELIDHEPGTDHSWLIWVDDNDVGTIIDPTILDFFRVHGVPLGLQWELTSAD